MSGNLPEGVTVLKRPQQLVSIPDRELHDLLETARGFFARAAERGYKPGYRLNQAKGMTGEHEAIREVLRRLPAGTQSVWVPSRNVNVDILDGLLVQPDGTYVVIEAKFQTGGGNPVLGTTNRVVLTADAGGNVQVTKIKGGTTQLSREWLKDRIAEISARARKLAGPERRAAKRLARDLDEALRAGRIRALAVSVTEQGTVDVVVDRTRELYGALGQPSAATGGAGSGSAAERGVSGTERGTGSRGVDDDVATKRSSRTATSVGSDDAPSAGSAPRAAAAVTDDVAGDVANVRTRTGRLAGGFQKVSRFSPKFTGTVILEVAKAVLFGALRAKLAKVNLEMTAASYARNVYEPYIAPHVLQAIRLGRSEEWDVARPKDVNRYVYLVHGYEVRMHQEAETLADAIVIVGGGFEIAETLQEVRATRPGDLWWLSRKTPLSEQAILEVDKRRKTDEKDVVSYFHRRATLVYSPRVAQAWRWIDGVQDDAIRQLNALAARLEADGYGPWVAKGASAIAEQVNDAAFLAATWTVELARIPLPATYHAELSRLQLSLLRGDVGLGLAAGYRRDERALLVAYLGVDPFLSRRRMERELRRSKERERIRRIQEMARHAGWR
ncbi:hypothetical protein [uncultured Phycicoccus sp.]|uniref:hypothetical protein n=1 Tax=uncultured Phycicoccus sp. TaxID=661422 RepID=UPI0026187F79|nr:hypothetical protein [uncultured Phycicoccus sp.]